MHLENVKTPDSRTSDLFYRGPHRLGWTGSGRISHNLDYQTSNIKLEDIYVLRGTVPDALIPRGPGLGHRHHPNRLTRLHPIIAGSNNLVHLIGVGSNRL